MSSFYITTPIYYVNAEPHIGHAYTTIASDVLARYQRLKGNSVYFLTGVDEHGINIQKVADQKGVSPQDYCNQIAPTFTQLWQKLNISNDAFIRTTSDLHKSGVAKFFTQLYQSGDVYQGKYEGLYCQHCERFFTEKELGENELCPIHRKPVDKVVEENYFFALTKYQDQLIDFIESNPSFIEPASRRNEIMEVLKSGLQDVSISRSSVDWGIPLPFDSEQNIYVWAEALANYITALDYHCDGAKFKQFWPASVHMMAKEITRFHVIIWPAMLMAVGLPLPKQIFAHGWLTKDGEKISKTTGNVIDMDSLIEEFGLDPFRYFFMREFSFGNDGDYTYQRLVTRYNSDLANDLGNLLSRVLGLLNKHFDTLPEPSGQAEMIDDEIKQMAKITTERLDHLMDQISLDMALETIWEFVRRINKYIQETKAWSLKDQKVRMGTILYNAMEALRVISVYLTPFMPQIAAKIQTQIGVDPNLQNLKSVEKWGGLPSGLPIAKTASLFPRKESKKSELTEKGSVPIKGTIQKSTDNLITIEQVKNLELRVCQVVSAEQVANSDRLLKLQVDLGKEKRQVVAGIAPIYTTESVIGKQVVLVANLQSTKIRGVESQGMLLAAVRKKELSLLTVDQAINNGTRIS